MRLFSISKSIFIGLVISIATIIVATIPVGAQNISTLQWEIGRSLTITQTFVQTLTVNGVTIPSTAITCKVLTATTTDCEAQIPNLNATGNNIIISVFDKATNTTAETKINNFSAATFPPNPTSPKLKLVQNISFP